MQDQPYSFIFYRLVLFMACVVMTYGCTSSYTSSLLNKQLQDVGLAASYTVKRSYNWAIPQENSVVIVAYNSHISKSDAFNASATAKNGFSQDYYRSQLSPRAYHHLQTSLLNAMSQKVARADFIELKNENDLSAQIINNEIDFIIVPSLIAKTDGINTLDERKFAKVTQNAKKRADKVICKVVIYRAYDRVVLDTVTVEAKSARISSNDRDIHHHIEKSVAAMMESLIF